MTISLEASLSLVTTGLLLVLIWFSSRIGVELLSRVDRLELELAQALGSIEERIGEGLRQLLEDGLDLPEPPNLAQQAIAGFIQQQLAPQIGAARDPDSGQFRGLDGEAIDP